MSDPRMLVLLASFFCFALPSACGQRSSLLLAPPTEGEAGPGDDGAGAGGVVDAAFGSGGTDAGATGGAGGASAVMGGVGGVSVASGGVGGTSVSSGGAGGGLSLGCQYPSCLAKLLANCSADGPCTRQPPNPPATSGVKLCCANGVTTVKDVMVWAGGVLRVSIQVAKAGALCYTIAYYSPRYPTTYSYQWTDPSGQLVATATTPADAPSFTVVCPDGETQTLAPGCSLDGSDESQITAGSCP